MRNVILSPNFFDKKRFLFYSGVDTILGKSYKFWVLSGLFSDITVRFLAKAGFKNTLVYATRKSLRKEIKRIFRTYFSMNYLYIFPLKLQGVGFRCIAPKRYEHKYLRLRIGFAASEIAYVLNSTNVRLRAKKQKLVLYGFNKATITGLAKQIIDLKYPNAFTGKGFRPANKVLVLKKRKQQQRGK